MNLTSRSPGQKLYRAPAPWTRVRPKWTLKAWSRWVGVPAAPPLPPLDAIVFLLHVVLHLLADLLDCNCGAAQRDSTCASHQRPCILIARIVHLWLCA